MVIDEWILWNNYLKYCWIYTCISSFSISYTDLHPWTQWTLKIILSIVNIILLYKFTDLTYYAKKLILHKKVYKNCLQSKPPKISHYHLKKLSVRWTHEPRQIHTHKTYNTAYYPWPERPVTSPVIISPLRNVEKRSNLFQRKIPNPPNFFV